MAVYLRRNHLLLSCSKMLRTIIWSTATVACISWVAVSLETSSLGAPAFAQAAPDMPSPPANAPIMRPGQKVSQSYGWLEVSTFSRSRDGNDSVFTIEFNVFNGSRAPILMDPGSVRLITDGLPRAPSTNAGFRVVASESVEERFAASFRIRGQPRVVFVQFVFVQFGGSGGDRSYLRWPD